MFLWILSTPIHIHIRQRTARKRVVIAKTTPPSCSRDTKNATSTIIYSPSNEPYKNLYRTMPPCPQKSNMPSVRHFYKLNHVNYGMNWWRRHKGERRRYWNGIKSIIIPIMGRRRVIIMMRRLGRRRKMKMMMTTIIIDQNVQNHS